MESLFSDGNIIFEIGVLSFLNFFAFGIKGEGSLDRPLVLDTSVHVNGVILGQQCHYGMGLARGHFLVIYGPKTGVLGDGHILLFSHEQSLPFLNFFLRVHSRYLIIISNAFPMHLKLGQLPKIYRLLLFSSVRSPSALHFPSFAQTPYFCLAICELIALSAPKIIDKN